MNIREILKELSYEGNVGVMELVKFFDKASPTQIRLFKSAVESKMPKKAWELVQKVVGTKLVGVGESINEDNPPNITGKGYISAVDQTILDTIKRLGLTGAEQYFQKHPRGPKGKGWPLFPGRFKKYRSHYERWARKSGVTEGFLQLHTEASVTRAHGYSVGDAVKHKGMSGKITQITLGNVGGKQSLWARVEHPGGTAHWVDLKSKKALTKEGMSEDVGGNWKGRSPAMQQFIDKMSQKIFGTSHSDAISKKICVICKNPTRHFHDAKSAKEFQISGMCQSCQDKTFG